MLDYSPFDTAAVLLADEWERAACPSCGLREDQWPHFTEDTGYCAGCEAVHLRQESMGKTRQPGERVEFQPMRPGDAPIVRFVDPDWETR